MNAKLYQDGIDVSYTIPEEAGNVLGRLIVDVLYGFYMHFDHDLLFKALETDEDLYLYNEEKIKKEMEEIKNRHNKQVD